MTSISSKQDLLAKRTRLYQQLHSINQQLADLDRHERLNHAESIASTDRNTTPLKHLVSKRLYCALARALGTWSPTVADLPSDLSELLKLAGFGPGHLRELTQALDALQPTT